MAQIDASIPLGVRPVQMPDQMNALARVMQIKGFQQEQELGGLKMDEYRRGIEDQNALRAALSAPDADPYKVLLGRGKVTEALAWQKGQGDHAKQKMELVDARLKQSRAFLDNVRTPEQYLAWHEANHADPILGPELAARGVTAEQSRMAIMQELQQPGGLERLLQKSALGMEKFTEQNKPTYQTQSSGQVDNLLAIPGLGGAPQVVSSVQKQMTPGEVATDARGREQIGISREQLGVAQGNLSVSQQRLEMERNAPRGQFIETTNGYVLADPRDPSNVRPVLGPDGKPLKGKAADRSLNETQAKANLFGTRMKEADRILTSLEGKYSPAAVNAKSAAGELPVIGGIAGMAGNAMLSGQGQQAEQAQRDFINAVLRRESGAAIAATEFENAKKQYFPQPNDKPENRAQKRRNRQLAIQGLEVEVPGGFRSSPTLTNPASGDSGATGGWDASSDPLGIRGKK